MEPFAGICKPLATAPDMLGAGQTQGQNANRLLAYTYQNLNGIFREPEWYSRGQNARRGPTKKSGNGRSLVLLVVHATARDGEVCVQGKANDTVPAVLSSSDSVATIFYGGFEVSKVWRGEYL
jgi:hypothetical protein